MPGTAEKQVGSVAEPKETQVPVDDTLSFTESDTRTGLAQGLALVVAMWFLLGAYRVNSYLSDSGSLLESVAGLDYWYSSETRDFMLQSWNAWVWIALTGIAAIISFVAVQHLITSRRKGEGPYYLLAAAGLAVSLSIIVVLGMELTWFVREYISPDVGVLWPRTMPLWFIPLSALGASLPLVALMISRFGDWRDNAAGAILSLTPVLMTSLPFLLGFDLADMVRWTPTIFAVSGVALIVAGLRFFYYSSTLTVESFDYASSRLAIGALLVAGFFTWRSVTGGDDLSSSADLVWFVPSVAGLMLSIGLLIVVGRKPKTRNGFAAQLMGIAGLELSLVMTVLLLFGFVDLVTIERTMWLYPLSLTGITLVMIAVNLVGIRTRTDRVVGVVSGLCPVVATSLVALMGGLGMMGFDPVLGGFEGFLRLLDGVLTTSVEAHPFLSGSVGMLAFVLLAAAVMVSGLKVETFWKSQLPVMREKSKLSRERTRDVMKQVMKNPMGAVGVVILIAFGILAIIGPYVAPYEVDMTKDGAFDKLMDQSPEHIMGTDTFGHDIFSELLIGARTSIIVGIVAAAISSVLGAVIGLYSGYVGGWKDEVIMRLNDIVLSIPWLVLMIVIAAFMGSIDLVGIILVIGLTGWSGTARLVRAQVLSLRERQYVERAKAIGSDDMHIIGTHILPNSFPLVFANTILTVAISILSEATLSFLGLRPYGVVTWGTMLSYAQMTNAFMIGLHWWIIAPGMCIVLVVLGFTLLGYALDDVMNPKLRKR